MCLIDFSELAQYHLEADANWISKKIDTEHRKPANEEVVALPGIEISIYQAFKHLQIVHGASPPPDLTQPDKQ